MRLERMLVAGESMRPTLVDGDHLLVVRRPRRLGVGDLVVVQPPGRPLSVKRVVAAVEGGWWVEGDNAARSTDSRAYGPVPPTWVRGRVLWRYWPLRRRSS